MKLMKWKYIEDLLLCRCFRQNSMSINFYRKWYAFVGLLIIAPILLLGFYYSATKPIKQLHRRSEENEDKLFINWTSVTAANVVLPVSFDSRNETFDCRKTRLMTMRFPVCFYPRKIDARLSGSTQNGNYYERRSVTKVLRLLRLDRRLQFVDIGANIGIFSLPAARVARVLAVEPNWRSMSRLAKAVDLGGIISNITLVHNAVSNVRTTLNIGAHPINQGVSFLMNATECRMPRTNEPCNTISPVKTILLNDLLPLMRSRTALLKIDVEGHEVNVFTNVTAGKFFDKIDVRGVFMEWVVCKSKPEDIVRRLLNFFYSRHYTAFNVHTFTQLQKNYRRWPLNIFFKK